MTAAQSPESPRTETDVYPHPLYAWYIVAVLLLALTVSFVDRQILGLMVQPVRADLALSDTQISVLHGFAFAIFYTFLGIPLGRWADRGHRQAMIIFGVITWSLATVACGFASNFWELFTARVFVGVGEATLSPAAYSLIADYFRREQRARAMSVYSLGIIVGSGCALILGGLAVAATAQSGMISMPLLGEVRPWQAAFIIVGLPGFAVAALMSTVREVSRKEKGAGGGSLAEALAFVTSRARVLALVCFGFGLTSTIAFGFGAWLPTVFVRVHGWAPAEIATAMGISVLTFGMAGVIIGGWLADRAVMRGGADGLLRVAAMAIGLMLLGVPIVGLAPSPELSIAALCWVNIFLGVPVALAVPALHALTPNEFRGQVTALYLFAANVVSLGVAPTLIAAITDYGFQNDNAVGASLAIVASAATVIALMLLIAARPDYMKLTASNH